MAGSSRNQYRRRESKKILRGFLLFKGNDLIPVRFLAWRLGGLLSRAFRSRSPSIAKHRSSEVKPIFDRTGNRGWSCCKLSSDMATGARASCCLEKATFGGTAA